MAIETDDPDAEQRQDSDSSNSLTGFSMPSFAPLMAVGPTARTYFDDKGGFRPDAHPDYHPNIRNFNPVNITDKNIRAVMGGLAAIESGGNRTGHIDYGALGPDVGRGRGRALGGYQVMAENLPQWSREAGIDHAVTADEYLHNPDLQDRIVAAQIKKLAQKGYSAEDIASIWQSGRPLSQSQHASDGYTSTPVYVQRFLSHYNPDEAESTQVAVGSRNNLRAMSPAVSVGGSALPAPTVKIADAANDDKLAAPKPHVPGSAPAIPLHAAAAPQTT